MSSARNHVVEILGNFYKSKLNLKVIQNQYFIRKNIEPLERNRTVVLTRDVIRWKSRLDWYIKSYIDAPFSKLQPKLLAILELATYELLFDEQVPNYAAINSAVELAKLKFNKKTSGLVNAILRKISQIKIDEKPTQIADHDWYSHPKWLYEKWTNQFGTEKTQKLCNHFNAQTPLVIRRNILKVDHNNFVNKLNEIDVNTLQIYNSDNFYTIESNGGKLINSILFKEGYFSFQDRAAGAIVELLDPQPNETILDICCAPGTKTNYIAEIMQNSGKIYASDSDIARINTTKNDQRRLNNNIIWEQKDATKDTFPMADKVLIDAPCTGTGVIGRRPDIKWRRKPEHIASAIALQKALLNNVFQFVKPGGTLVYATCSLEEEENWQVVEAFLKLHTDFKVKFSDNPYLMDFIDTKGALNTFPPISNTDGMFAVKMTRSHE